MAAATASWPRRWAKRTFSPTETSTRGMQWRYLVRVRARLRARVRARVRGRARARARARINAVAVPG